MTSDSAVLDQLEMQIIRCLQVAPRVPFSAVAEVLEVSEQTVARRYRRLVRAGLVRVTAAVDPDALGQNSWVVRTQCRPGTAMSLARALAERDDISWVTLLSGGSEIVCTLQARTSEARDDLLMERLPRTAPVLGMSASMVLHRFVGGSASIDKDWMGLAGLLDAAQERTLLERAAVDLPSGPPPSVRATWLESDAAIIDLLVHDGRASYAALAAATDSTEARVARRVRALLASGVAYLDVDVSTTALGFRTTATLWLTVTPAELDAAGRALMQAHEVAFAAAISGTSNLTAAIVCRNVAHLYRFVTDTVGSIPGVQSVEITPAVRNVKQAGSLTSGDRLVSP